MSGDWKFPLYKGSNEESLHEELTVHENVSYNCMECSGEAYSLINALMKNADSSRPNFSWRVNPEALGIYLSQRNREILYFRMRRLPRSYRLRHIRISLRHWFDKLVTDKIIEMAELGDSFLCYACGKQIPCNQSIAVKGSFTLWKLRPYRCRRFSEKPFIFYI